MQSRPSESDTWCKLPPGGQWGYSALNHQIVQRISIRKIPPFFALCSKRKSNNFFIMETTNDCWESLLLPMILGVSRTPRGRPKGLPTPLGKCRPSLLADLWPLILLPCWPAGYQSSREEPSASSLPPWPYWLCQSGNVPLRLQPRRRCWPRTAPVRQ